MRLAPIQPGDGGSSPVAAPRWGVSVPTRTQVPSAIDFKVSTANYMNGPESRYSWEEIVQLMNMRRWADSALLRQMVEVRDRYNGDVIVPLPDMEGEPQQAAPVARMIADAIDHTALRASSVKPETFSPALDPGSSRSRKRSETRTRAFRAIWHDNMVADVLLRRAFRHLIGYGTMAWIVLPDFVDGRPSIEMRDPLSTYPELRTPEDMHDPRNCGFIYGRSASWIVTHYPEAEPYLQRAKQWDTLWDMVEWIDHNDVVIGVLGPRSPITSTAQQPERQPFGGMELRRYPNRAGMVPVSIPRRVTLNRIFGQIASMVPIVDLMGRLTTLDIMAAEKAIFADMVLMSRDGRTPQVAGGEWKDGRTGEVNIVIDGEARLLQSSPGPMTHSVIDRLERSIRTSTGLIPEFGGETSGAALRTGKAIDSMAGMSIDPRVQEAQELMARSLVVVNEATAAVLKGYFGRKTFSMFSGSAGDMGHVVFDASDFETAENAVVYAFPGADLTQTTVAVAQLVGAGLVSKYTGRVKHPFIENPDREGARVVEEKVEEAMLVATLQQAQSGAMPMTDLARIRQRVKAGADLADAIVAQQLEAQQRQAEVAQPPGPGAVGPTGAPLGGPPAAQPGLALPGAGAETTTATPVSPEPTIEGPAQAQVNLKRLLRTIKSS